MCAPPIAAMGGAEQVVVNSVCVWNGGIEEPILDKTMVFHGMRDLNANLSYQLKKNLSPT